MIDGFLFNEGEARGLFMRGWGGGFREMNWQQGRDWMIFKGMMVISENWI